MTLRETMARDARRTLTRLDHFGELVTYVFKNGDPDRVVPAVVNRQDIEPAQTNVPQVGRRRAVVAIPFHDVDGVQTYVQGDRIELALRLGEAAVQARIRRVVSQDEGMWEFEVEG
jgi:hypothetical protein